LAITSIVVGSTALVAGGRARTSCKTSSEATGKASAGDPGAATYSSSSRVRAGASKMARLATGVAAAAGTGAAQTKGRTVSLHMTEALAVVALLGLGGARVRAAVRLMARLLAVVAETLGRGADLSVVTDIATLVAGTAR